MKERYLRFLSLVLILSMLLSGCGDSIADAISQREELQDKIPEETRTQQEEPTHVQEESTRPEKQTFSQMEYSRPDMQAMEETLAQSCRIAREETDEEKVMQAVYDFYDVYDRFCTDLTLADIHYSCDLTDSYWQEEYDFCLEQASVADAGLDELYCALAESPIREELEQGYFGKGFFESYDGESVYDDAFLSLLEQEAQLQSKYQQIMATAGDTRTNREAFLDKNAEILTQVLVELVLVRRQLARESGYENYSDFAYDFYHYRDYTAQQAKAYMEQVPVVMGDLYRKINVSQVWDLGYDYCAEEDTFAYVRTAAENMGKTANRAFTELENRELYHISYSPNKADGGYEAYLWSYSCPFVYLSPYQDQTDKLSFAHEFGHFLNDYACKGSYVGTDIAEIHSQSFEYLSLCYGENTEELESYKLATSLCTYMEQTAYALFEQKLYEMEEEALTVENVMALYEEIGLDFAFDSWNWDSRDFVLIDHFYTEPMYIISYVVSNDMAMQIYQMEKESPGAGLRAYELCIKSQDSCLLAFAQEYDLESPFAPGRLEQARDILQEGLADYL